MNERGGKEDLTNDTKPMIKRLLELDVELGTQVSEMEAQQPDLFATRDAQIKFIADAAILAGKREILNELIQEFGPPEPPEQ